MGKPNTLSCRADHGSGQGNNNNLSLLSLTLFHIHALSGTQLEGNECNILREEEPVVMAAQELNKDKAHGTIWSTEWSQVMGYSCSEVRSMSQKTETLGFTSLSNITIHTSLDMQATLRHFNLYHTTTGGHKCPDTSESMSTPVTFAIRLNCNVINLMESFTPQRLQKIDGMSSALTLLLNFFRCMATT
jgi:hypothetical protein